MRAGWCGCPPACRPRGVRHRAGHRQHIGRDERRADHFGIVEQEQRARGSRTARRGRRRSATRTRGSGVARAKWWRRIRPPARWRAAASRESSAQQPREEVTARARSEARADLARASVAAARDRPRIRRARFEFLAQRARSIGRTAAAGSQCRPRAAPRPEPGRGEVDVVDHVDEQAARSPHRDGAVDSPSSVARSQAQPRQPGVMKRPRGAEIPSRRSPRAADPARRATRTPNRLRQSVILPWPPHAAHTSTGRLRRSANSGRWASC